MAFPIRPDCLPCAQRQVLRVARAANHNDWLQKRALMAVLEELQDTDFTPTPAELLSRCLEVVRPILGTSDPYAEARAELAGRLEGLQQTMRGRIEAEASLEAALRAAAAGNVVDALALRDFDPAAAIEAAWSKGFARAAREPALEALEAASSVLYLVDNAGELLFDLLLVEALERRGKRVELVVKPAGLLHDATAEDVPGRAVLETGSAQMGALPALCGEAFKAALGEAELVIAKGSAAFETLDLDGTPGIVLLCAKCEVIASELGVSRGEMVMIFADGRGDLV